MCFMFRCYTERDAVLGSSSGGPPSQKKKYIRQCCEDQGVAGGSTWQKTGHQVSPSSHRRRKRKERERRYGGRRRRRRSSPAPHFYFPLSSSASLSSLCLARSVFFSDFLGESVRSKVNRKRAAFICRVCCKVWRGRESLNGSVC